MDGDPQLFGVAPRNVVRATLDVTPPQGEQSGSVHFMVQTRERRAEMQLLCVSLTNDQMATAVGYMVPLLLKSHYVNASTLKRHMWAVFRTMGIAGRECVIRGCGRNTND